MKRHGWVLLSCLILCNVRPTMATPQVRTLLDVNGTNHYVRGFALRQDMRDAFRRNVHKLPAITSNNWKGYHAELEVRNDRLYLARLSIDRPLGWRGMLTRGPSIKTLFGTFVPSEGLPADWFTGELEEEVQDMLSSMGVSEQSRFFVFEKGVLRTIEVREASIVRKMREWGIRSSDDGDLKRGVPWPNPRFTVGSGVASNCVMDNLTGLMWVRKPDATERDWSTALTYCIGLDGGAGRGGFTDWRLPTVQELHSLIDYGRYSPALPSGHPFIGLQGSYYWSNTGYAVGEGTAWRVYLLNGHVFPGNKTSANHVWPVRCRDIGAPKKAEGPATRSGGEEVGPANNR